ncbi:hypothetical protein [Streptomyces spiramyceticus]|uniref:DUF7847 domain-containing protein n=1 Tax=Streptomyces spiramyceticus TaxID=299717 RepID=UPI00237B7F80|nr:hypothetical protein [Streptomyces spiramyceticus]
MKRNGVTVAHDSGWNGPHGGGPYAGPPPPGWGGGWMPPPPPPPKPGVIPLGPLGLGDILGGTFTTMGRYWKQLFGIAVLMYGGALLVVVGAVAIALSATHDTLQTVFDSANDEDPPWDELWTLLISFGVVWIVAMLSMVVATATIMAACPAVLQDAVLGRRTTFGAVWRRAWPRVPAVIGAMLLPWLVAMVTMGLFMVSYVVLIVSFLSQDTSGAWAALGFVVFLAFIPLAVWLWVRFSLAPAAVVFESQGPVAALRRSSQLVQGAWWRIFGITVLASIMAMVAGYIIQLPLTMIGALTSMPGMAEVGPEPGVGEALVAMGSYLVFILLGSIISQIVATTFPQLVTGLLYVDQRIRKENLAPVLAEAAADRY